MRNAGNISSAYSIVICDEAHTALGEKTSAAIREWTGPVFIGMTATGALIARHVTDLFPTQTSRFDLAQAARRGVISPLRCVRIPPGPGVRTIAKVPLRRGEVDVEFDQEMLAELLDQAPFNYAVADLYKVRFNGVPGVVYAAGVRHAYNVAAAFREQGMKAMAVSGETKKRELAEILASYERGDIDVLVNAQLLAEGWNSPRATVCMHLAPTASKRIYQQRVGRVTRRHPGKEAGLVVDFVAPDTKNDDPVVTLHSLLDRDVYRGGAIVVGPVRRGRGRRVRVERRVLPVTADEDRRIDVFERELWRIAVEHLPYGEQIQWAALAGARVAPSGWRRARAMLHFDRGGEFKRAFLLTAVQRNQNPQLRIRALQEIAALRDGEAFDTAIDVIGTWTREERREGTKVMLLALAEKRIGRRDQANAWIWRLASYTREVHEEYAVQRWPETKRLLGLLVNSSGAAHARNARRLVHAARKQDRRLSAAILAAAIAHSPEGEEILRGARTRLARKPSALSRELLRNFPKARGRRGNRRRRKKGAGEGGSEGALVNVTAGQNGAVDDLVTADGGDGGATGGGNGSGGSGAGDGRSGSSRRRSRRSRNGRTRNADPDRAEAATADRDGAPTTATRECASRSPTRLRSVRPRAGRAVARAPEPPVDDAAAVSAIADAAAALAAARGPKRAEAKPEEAAPEPRRSPRRRAGAHRPAGRLTWPRPARRYRPASWSRTPRHRQARRLRPRTGPPAAVRPPSALRPWRRRTRRRRRRRRAWRPSPRRRPAPARSRSPSPSPRRGWPKPRPTNLRPSPPAGRRCGALRSSRRPPREPPTTRRRRIRSTTTSSPPPERRVQWRSAAASPAVSTSPSAPMPTPAAIADRVLERAERHAGRAHERRLPASTTRPRRRPRAPPRRRARARRERAARALGPAQPRARRARRRRAA